MGRRYDFLTEELPPGLRAAPSGTTKALTTQDLALTPLQLAAQLGDHAMVRHILRKQCEVMWKWGPVTQYSLALDGVDSAGKGVGDIMELIVRCVHARDPHHRHSCHAQIPSRPPDRARSCQIVRRSPRGRPVSDA